MRSNQTLQFYEKMMKKYSFVTPRAHLSIPEAFVALEGYVDSSDPDVDLPNIIHMFQTAEGIRAAGHPDWMQLVGLIHDMGKIMFLWGDEEDGQNGTATGSQWALGGDTWVLGVPIPDTAVFPEFNTLNPDEKMTRACASPEIGIYEAGCGLSALKFAYGHDEYLYHMLVANETTIPREGLAMVRFHSLYPWHTGGAYRALMNEEDKEMLEW
jgi:inositol oxygenase